MACRKAPQLGPELKLKEKQVTDSTRNTNEGQVVHCKRKPFDVYIGRPRPG
jgi:hypothetical protein